MGTLLLFSSDACGRGHCGFCVLSSAASDALITRWPPGMPSLQKYVLSHIFCCCSPDLPLMDQDWMVATSFELNFDNTLSSCLVRDLELYKSKFPDRLFAREYFFRKNSFGVIRRMTTDLQKVKQTLPQL